MYCKNCGTKLAEGAHFCAKCGAAQEPFGDMPYEDPKKEVNISISKKTLKRAGIVLAILCLAAAAVAGGRKLYQELHRVDILSYVELGFTGYDGYGDLEVSYPEIKKLAQTLTGYENISDGDYYQLDILLAEGIQLSEEDSLSNGDEVEVKLSNLSDFESTYRVKFKERVSRTVEVKGLKETQQYDPSGDLSVTFSGTDGYGSAQLTLASNEILPTFLSVSEWDEDDDEDDNDSENQSVWGIFEDSDEDRDYPVGRIYLAEDGTLTNGDTVTLTISWDKDQVSYFARDYGIELGGETEKTAVVSGLSELNKINLMDYVTVDFQGVSEDAEACAVWNQTEDIQVGNLTISPSGEYCDEIYISYTAEDGEPVVDSVNLLCDPSEGISVGDTIYVWAEFDDMELGSDYYVEQGVSLGETSMEWLVEADEVERYLTQGDYPSQEAIQTAAGAVSESMAAACTEMLWDDWDWVVHGGDFSSENQQIAADPAVSRVYLVYDEYAGAYYLYTLMRVKVLDSTMETAQDIYLLCNCGMPLVSSDGTLRMEYTTFSTDDYYDTSWYTYGNAEIYITENICGEAGFLAYALE